MRGTCHWLTGQPQGFPASQVSVQHSMAVGHGAGEALLGWPWDTTGRLMAWPGSPHTCACPCTAPSPCHPGGTCSAVRKWGKAPKGKEHIAKNWSQKRRGSSRSSPTRQHMLPCSITLHLQSTHSKIKSRISKQGGPANHRTPSLSPSWHRALGDCTGDIPIKSILIATLKRTSLVKGKWKSEGSLSRFYQNCMWTI